MRLRSRGGTRITRKNQSRLPAEALRLAGLKPGDELVVAASPQSTRDREFGMQIVALTPIWLARRRDCGRALDALVLATVEVLGLQTVLTGDAARVRHSPRAKLI